MKKIGLLLLLVTTIFILSACDPETETTWTGTGHVSIFVGDMTTTCGEVTAIGNDGVNYTEFIELERDELDRNTPGVYEVKYFISENNLPKSDDDHVGFCEYTVVEAFSGISDQTVMYGESFYPLDGVTVTDLQGNDRTSDIEYTSMVDTLQVGTYTVTYELEVTDSYWITQTSTVTVISDFDPVFTGINDVVLTLGDSFDETLGISAFDFEDGNITSSISVSGTVDLSTAGTYTLTYMITDNDGNTITQTRTITIETDTDPEITGVSDFTIYEGSSLEEFAAALYDGVMATDFEDGDITNLLEVDYPTVTGVGEYTVTYTITDSDNNEISATATMTVIEDNAPVISGTEDFMVYQSESFDLLSNVTALDDKDGDITSSIEVTHSIDMMTPDTYPVIYTVIDSFGNETSITVDFVLLEDMAPVLNGLDDFSIEQGGTYDLYDGVTATDDLDGDLTSSIEVTDTIDTDIPGEYMVTYSVMDSYGNETEVMITVTVTAPVLDYTGTVLYAIAYDVDTVDITFDVDFIDNLEVDLSAFTITINGVETTITDSFIFVDTVSFDITDIMDNNSVVLITYTPTGTNDITYAGGMLVPEFTNQSVTPPSLP